MRGASKKKGILLYVDTYKIPGKEPGEVNSGLKGMYFPDESLEDWNRDEQARDGNIIRGMEPMPISLPFEYKDKLVSVPGMYYFTEEYKRIKTKNEYGEKLHQGITITDIEFVGDIMLEVVQPDKK